MFKKDAPIIKKADIVLAAVLVAVGIAMSFAFTFGQSGGHEVVITVDGEKFGTYSLFEDREVVIEEGGHINKVTIKDGEVSMGFSDCHGQDCVDQGAVSETGESIICLPNKVVLEIEGGKAEYDTIAK